MPEPTRFPVTADVVLLALRGDSSGGGSPRVLLIERGHDPFAGCLALPGGFVDPGEVTREAALRELAEETSLAEVPVELEQLGAYGPGGGRDPRGETLTVVYFAVVEEPLPVRAADDAAAAEWIAVDEALQPGRLAFDHGLILADAVRRAAERHPELHGPVG